MRCSWGSSEELSIDLHIDTDMSKGEFEGLRALQGRARRKIEVIITGQAEMGQERYKQLVNVVLGECKSLERLVLEFKTKQEKLIVLEFLASLDERGGTFPKLKYFEITGVDAPCMMKLLGVEGAEGMDKLEGAWDEKSGKWKLEGLLRP